MELNKYLNIKNNNKNGKWNYKKRKILYFI